MTYAAVAGGPCDGRSAHRVSWPGGGPWLCKVLVPSGLVAVVVPSPCKLQGPAPAVHGDQVVKSAQKGQVVQAGRAALRPGDHVMHLAADGRRGAAGEATVPVAFGDGAAEVGRDLLGGLAEVQGEAGCGEEPAGELGPQVGGEAGGAGQQADGVAQQGVLEPGQPAGRQRAAAGAAAGSGRGGAGRGGAGEAGRDRAGGGGLAGRGGLARGAAGGLAGRGGDGLAGRGRSRSWSAGRRGWGRGARAGARRIRSGGRGRAPARLLVTRLARSPASRSVTRRARALRSRWPQTMGAIFASHE